MKLRSATLSLLFLALYSLAAWAQAPQLSSFSADMKTTSPQGDNGTGKMYFSGETKKIRMDMSMHGQEVGVIADGTNSANPKSTILMKEQKMYMQMSSFGAGPGMKKPPQVHVYDASNPCADMEGTTCKKVGTETVNGYPCDKWEFTGKENQTVWISQQHHFPIKTVQPDGTTVEFSNIKEGPQEASLFEVPSDYKKFDMMGMMGGHSKQ